jgi:hypothetical protein
LLAHSLAAVHGCPIILRPQLPFTHACPLTQSASLAQRLMQAPSAQRNGSQFCTPGGRQLPTPLQPPAVFSRSPLHDGAEQMVSAAYRAQPPIPSQAPVVPQVAATSTLQMPCGSETPASVGQQVPRRSCWLQLTQAASQAMLQQTPSVQKPEPHSLSPLQTAPIGLAPQLPFAHSVPLAQSELDVHVVAHLFVAGLQLYGAQIVVGPALQCPWPSQTLMPLTEAPSHVPDLQIVPAGCLRQWPCPSQVPSPPQLEAGEAAHAAESSCIPFGTNEHVPGALWLLHVLHVSVQAVSQQRPSTQKPL